MPLIGNNLNNTLSTSSHDEDIFGFGGNDILGVNYTLLIPNTTTTPPVGDWKLFGGYGADKLTVNANINAGANPNFVFSPYAASALFAGDAGNDTISGSIKINSNPLGYPFGGGADITQIAMDSGGNNKVTLNSSAYVADGMNLLTHIVDTGSGNDTISSTTSADGENLRTSAVIHIDAGDGKNGITVKDTSGDLVLDVISGIGADTLNLTLNADPANAQGYDAVGNIATGGGNDIVNLTFGEFEDGPVDVDFVIDLGNGDNTLNVNAAQGGNFDIDSYGGNDIINFKFPTNGAWEVTDLYVNVNARDGDNSVILNLYDADPFNSVVSHADVITGSGKDNITLYYGTNSTVQSGVGADTIKALGTSESVDAGAGNDVIFIQSGNDTVKGGLGADTFRFNDTNSANFAGDTHQIDLDFTQFDKLVFTGAFNATGVGPTIDSYSELVTFDNNNNTNTGTARNFEYNDADNSGSISLGDTITYYDLSNIDLITINLI